HSTALHPSPRAIPSPSPKLFPVRPKRSSQPASPETNVGAGIYPFHIHTISLKLSAEVHRGSNSKDCIHDTSLSKTATKSESERTDRTSHSEGTMGGQSMAFSVHDSSALGWPPGPPRPIPTGGGRRTLAAAAGCLLPLHQPQPLPLATSSSCSRWPSPGLWASGTAPCSAAAPPASPSAPARPAMAPALRCCARSSRSHSCSVPATSIEPPFPLSRSVPQPPPPIPRPSTPIARQCTNHVSQYTTTSEGKSATRGATAPAPP
ncbi:hypothetical protein MARPO_1462s0001, partial [Marchantia polymorpha]